MFNVLLDPLPEEWKGFQIDSDFQIGIMISQCVKDQTLNNAEKLNIAAGLLFGENRPSNYKDIADAIQWFLNGWNQDNLSARSSAKKKTESESIDFDTDQWRIYAAFKSQYGIDLNKEKMHFWAYMGLLSGLEECAFTRVISIREKKIDSKMSKEEKSFLKKAKEVFRIRKEVDVDETEEEQKERQTAIEEFNRLRRNRE